MADVIYISRRIRITRPPRSERIPVEVLEELIGLEFPIYSVIPSIISPTKEILLCEFYVNKDIFLSILKRKKPEVALWFRQNIHVLGKPYIVIREDECEKIGWH